MVRKASTTRSAPEPVIAPPKSRPFPTFVVVVLAIVLVTAGILSLKHKLTKSGGPAENVPGQEVSQDEINSLIAKVGTHIYMKTDEQPTVATIQDVEMLRAQNLGFYRDAENGDRLLVWSDKAVLYSPTKDRVLSMIPVNFAQQGSSPAQETPTETATTTAPEPETATIEVRNGSPTAGRGRLMVDKLKSAGLTDVLAATDARVKTYAKTVIIVASDKELPQTVAAIQAATGAEVISAPTEEGTLRGDIVVIVGADFQP
jgi:hypothetical protein